MPEENYHEEYVINIMTEQAELNLKYGPKFADQSKRNKVKSEIRNNTDTKNEHIKNQSKTKNFWEHIQREQHPNRTEHLHPGSRIIPLRIPVANCKTKILESWTENTSTTEESTWTKI